MAKVIAGMTISLDGFIEDRTGSAGPLGSDFDALMDSDYMREAIEETGAVVMGRRTFDMADDPDSFVGNYEFQVPLFIVTHNPPPVMPKQDERLTFTFVTEGPGMAIAKAKVAAGEKAVTIVGGADLIRQALEAGLVDELHVDVMPVLLGDGLRLFEKLDVVRLDLEKLSVQEVGPRTSLRFRVPR